MISDKSLEISLILNDVQIIPKVIVQVAAARYCQSGSLTSRLGHSLDVVDVNGDSTLDVIVGAPGSGLDCVPILEILIVRKIDESKGIILLSNC